MSRKKRHDWNAPDDIEHGDLDENSISSDDNSNAVRYVPTSAGSPVKVLSRLGHKKLSAEHPAG